MWMDGPRERQALGGGVAGSWAMTEDLFLGTQDLSVLGLYRGREGEGEREKEKGARQAGHGP